MRIYRDHYNKLNIKTVRQMTIKGTRANLNIHTSKSDSGFLSTTVSVGWPSADNRSETHSIFGDYYVIFANEKVSRVTEKVACAQHEAVLKDFDAVVKAVEAHYAKEVY